MRTQSAEPLIYAHRGASAYAPENTLAAFRLALEQGAHGIELDAKLSADGEIVVIHDQTVGRTTPGKGRVDQLTLFELRKLDAGSWKGDAFSGEKIPTLAEVFASVGGKLTINVELTNYSSPQDGLPEKALALVQEYQLEDSILFSSFLLSNLAAVRQVWPKAPVGILADPGIKGLRNRSKFSREISPDYMHPHFLDVSRRLVEREKAAGRLLNVWTVNSAVVMRTLIRFGAAGIITDDPLLALKIRGEA
ncbi:MAG: glycerophosphodiester phosphodiesterase family protein [Bellilinea sp.]